MNAPLIGAWGLMPILLCFGASFFVFHKLVVLRFERAAEKALATFFEDAANTPWDVLERYGWPDPTPNLAVQKQPTPNTVFGSKIWRDDRKLPRLVYRLQFWGKPPDILLSEVGQSALQAFRRNKAFVWLTYMVFFVMLFLTAPPVSYVGWMLGLGLAFLIRRITLTPSPWSRQ